MAAVVDAKRNSIVRRTPLMRLGTHGAFVNFNGTTATSTTRAAPPPLATRPGEFHFATAVGVFQHFTKIPQMNDYV